MRPLPRVLLDADRMLARVADDEQPGGADALRAIAFSGGRPFFSRRHTPHGWRRAPT